MKNKKTSKKMKIIFIIIFTILILAATVLGLKKLNESLKNSDEITYTVREETYENVIEIAGTVSAAEEQTFQAKSDGTVLGVYVKKGDHVKKGQTIIQLDYQEQEYNLAKLDFDMVSKVITGSTKEIELLKKQRLSLLQKIEDRKIIATFDGIVADLDVQEEDSLEAKDSVGTLVNVDYLTAEVEIPETDVENLKIGQKVVFTFPAYDGEVVGYVESWPAIGELTSRGATIVNAKLRIDDYPESILPNYSFTGKIQITEPETYLIVESLAVGRENQKAFVQKVGSDEKIEVKVIPYGGKDYVRILGSRVQAGDKLKAQGKAKTSGRNKDRPGLGAMPMGAPSGGPGGMGGGPGPR